MVRFKGKISNCNNLIIPYSQKLSWGHSVSQTHFHFIYNYWVCIHHYWAMYIPLLGHHFIYKYWVMYILLLGQHFIHHYWVKAPTLNWVWPSKLVLWGLTSSAKIYWYILIYMFYQSKSKIVETVWFFPALLFLVGPNKWVSDYRPNKWASLSIYICGVWTRTSQLSATTTTCY